jgi:CHASE2 domain-containing sensor protein
VGTLSSIDWVALQTGLSFDFKRIIDFQFTYNNTLFWAILVLLCMLLIERWGFRRSIFFTLILAVILLMTTEVISWCTVLLFDPYNPFDPTIIKFIAVFLIAIIYIMHAVIRSP